MPNVKKKSKIIFSSLSESPSRQLLPSIMANWDDDDFEVPTTTVPVVTGKGKWEGEDEDEDDVPVPSSSLVLLIKKLTILG